MGRSALWENQEPAMQRRAMRNPRTGCQHSSCSYVCDEEILRRREPYLIPEDFPGGKAINHLLMAGSTIQEIAADYDVPTWAVVTSVSSLPTAVALDIERRMRAGEKMPNRSKLAAQYGEPVSRIRHFQKFFVGTTAVS